MIKEAVQKEHSKKCDQKTTSSNTDHHPFNNTTNMVCPPPITDAEKALLFQHDGCFKCQQFYAKHRAAECPNGFPSGQGYKPLTEVMAIAAKPRGVHAVMTADTVGEGSCSATIAAVMPDYSAVLGNGTDSDEYVAPL